MRMAIVIGLAALSLVPASAQGYCGTFSRCPTYNAVIPSERCFKMVELSEGDFSAAELAPLRASCEEMRTKEIEDMRGGPIDFGPSPLASPSPPNRVDELEQEVEDLKQRVEDLEN